MPRPQDGVSVAWGTQHLVIGNGRGPSKRFSIDRDAGKVINEGEAVLFEVEGFGLKSPASHVHWTRQAPATHGHVTVFLPTAIIALLMPALVYSLFRWGFIYINPTEEPDAP